MNIKNYQKIFIHEYNIYPLKKFELKKKPKIIKIEYMDISPIDIDEYTFDELIEIIEENIKEYIIDELNNEINRINYKDEINKKIKNELIKTKDKLNKIIKKDCEKLIVSIKYPLRVEAHFEVLFNKRDITIYDLYLIHGLIYQQIYDIDFKTSSRIKNETTRKNDGYYGIWGHDINELVYNGLLYYCDINSKKLWFNLDVDS